MAPSSAASAGFLAIVASLLALVPVAVRSAEQALGSDPARSRRRALIAFAATCAWLAVVAAPALGGALRNFDAMPPRLVFIVVPAVAACVVLTLSPAGRRLATGLPLASLAAYQAFRVPMELVLHRLFSEGVIPVQMTWSGRNLDVLSGLTALPIAWLASKGRAPRWLVLAWNVACLALLVNIVAVAILSTPYPFRHFTEGPANEVIFSWPFIWLPGFVVPMALLGHLLSFRALARASRTRS